MSLSRHFKVFSSQLFSDTTRLGVALVVELDDALLDVDGDAPPAHPRVRIVRVGTVGQSKDGHSLAILVIQEMDHGVALDFRGREATLVVNFAALGRVVLAVAAPHVFGLDDVLAFLVVVVGAIDHPQPFWDFHHPNAASGAMDANNWLLPLPRTRPFVFCPADHPNCPPGCFPCT